MISAGASCFCSETSGAVAVFAICACSELREGRDSVSVAPSLSSSSSSLPAPASESANSLSSVSKFTGDVASWCNCSQDSVVCVVDGTCSRTAGLMLCCASKSRLCSADERPNSMYHPSNKPQQQRADLNSVRENLPAARQFPCGRPHGQDQVRTFPPHSNSTSGSAADRMQTTQRNSVQSKPGQTFEECRK
eukprot:m.181160 g.181160  ORF g.181160 m.181160 type:complete len:192 (+) comp53462_c0_seq6:137-712(+)